MEPATTPAAGAPNATPPARRSGVGRVVAALFVSVLVVLVCAAVGGVWAVRSESGSVWLLERLPGVRAVGAQGALLGDAFEVQQLRVELPGAAGGRVTLTGFGWTGLHLARGSAGRWLDIVLDDLHANRVDVVLPPSPEPAPPAEPRRPPTDLRLPVDLDLRSLRIVELRATPLGEVPVRDLRAALHLGADAGESHRADAVSASWNGLALTAAVRIATRGGLPLDARVALRQPAGGALPAWDAEATLAGPIETPQLQATVRAQPAAGRPAQSIDARAVLRPFAAWPLGELQATVDALDLSAFSAAAPATALSGRAVTTTTAIDQPARLELDLANAAAGRWDERKLPLRRIVATLAARPDDPSRVELSALDAELGSGAAAAGRITGSGRYDPAGWALDAQVAGLEPSRLDARAPSMRLDGPLAASGALAGAAPGAAAGTGTSPPGPAVNLRMTLSGRWLDAGPVRTGRLALDASLDALRIDIRDATAEAGGARATLAGSAARADAAAPWRVAGKASLVGFDPRPWWPGPAGSAWRRARTSVDATARVDVVVPAAATTTTETLKGLRGDATVTVADSTRVAGVPIGGEATLRTAGGQATPTFHLDAAGNRVKADGRIALAGNGAADHWNVAIDAAALDKLAPVFRLFAAPGADAALAGRISATARVEGRWPALSTQGQLDARQLRFGNFGLQQAQGRWRGGTAAHAPLEADLTLAEAAIVSADAPTAPSLESLELHLAGTDTAHTLTMNAVSKALPPAWTELMLPPTKTAAGPVVVSGRPAPAPARTQATLQARGGFTPSATTAWAGWRGSVVQATLATRASADAPTPTAPLFATRDVQIDAAWGPGPARVGVQPGRAGVLGGAVRWDRVAWTAPAAPGAPAQIDARAVIEPLQVAPLLARLQPAFGWSGDLAVGGRLDIRSAPTFRADVVVERSGGDLSLTDDLGGKESLGLTDLRLALTAADGVWRFVPSVAGRLVGAAGGTVMARTSPTATSLAPETPLQGSLRLDVASLTAFGPWVPAGWRADGTLHAAATIGGRVGAPEVTGEIRGSKLSLRNFLQGVNIGDGELLIALRGDTAHIDRFTATAGSGQLRIEGDAVLGSAPRADLRITATQFQVLGRVDRRIVASGQARLKLDSKTLALDGRFGVDEGLIDFSRSDAPTLSEDVDVVRVRGVPAPDAVARAADAPPATTGRNTALDLKVSMGEKLRIRGHGLDAGLRGELAITSPGGRLTVVGSIATADGSYQAYGQKLVIDRGVIEFNGPVDNPRLDIEATRPGLDNIRVGVAVSGSTTNPRIRLFSEPEVSDVDKLSWLVMGKASDGLGRTDTALLQRAALALFSGEGPGTTDKLIKSIGLDELSVGQKGEGDVRDTVVSLGKQISRRWYVGYERGLNATAGSWQLIYRLAQRYTVRAQAGGDSSLDLIWTWRWQ